MDKVLQFIKVTNKWMKRIGTALGFGLSLTTYVARHSFSTMLLRSGASVEFISESLGHSDIKTTQFYLGGFDLDAKKEMMKALSIFDNAPALKHIHLPKYFKFNCCKKCNNWYRLEIGMCQFQCTFKQ